MFGINGTEFVILVVVALVVIGPKRLPEYAQKLRDTVKSIRRWALDLRDDMKSEMGDEFADVDWQKLDPRQYDPRRIVREALAEEDDAYTHRGTTAGGAVTGDGGAPGDGDRSGDNAAAEGTTATVTSPLERYREQVALRDESRAAPFDPDAT